MPSNRLLDMIEETEPTVAEPTVAGQEPVQEESFDDASDFFRNETKPKRKKLSFKERRARRKAAYINENKRFSTREPSKRPDPISENDDFDEMMFGDIEDAEDTENASTETAENVFSENLLEERKAKRKKIAGIVSQVIIITACVYLIFLIYGVIVTSFSYNAYGVIEPNVMTVSDIREKREFEILLGQYENCRSLYEKVLVLDYKVSQGIVDPMTLAPEYAALLDDKKMTNDVSDLTGQIKGMDIPAKYAPLQNMMYDWVTIDVAEYLQTIKDGLSLNDSGALAEALNQRTVIYNDFSTLTQNLVANGETINGLDVTDEKQWSPETYIEEYING